MTEVRKCFLIGTEYFVSMVQVLELLFILSLFKVNLGVDKLGVLQFKVCCQGVRGLEGFENGYFSRK
jgi:hypothetical protein